MCQPGLRHDLAKPSTNLRADLGFHQLAGDDRDRLPHEILKPPVADLRDDIGNRRHALNLRPSWCLHSRRLRLQPTSSAPRWPTLAAVDLHDVRYTTSTDTTDR